MPSIHSMSKPILITRSLRDASQFSQICGRYNLGVIGCTSIQVVENPSLPQLEFMSGYYDWIIFNSRYSAQIFLGALRKLGRLEYFVKAKKICAVGPETARVVHSYGVEVDNIPDVYAASGIVNLFKRKGISHQQILLTAGNQSDNWLMKQLDALGNQCTLVELYQSGAPKELPRYVMDSLLKANFSLLAVTSPSAAYNLLSLPQIAANPGALMAIPVASIGPKTSEACYSLGLNVMLESPVHTLNGLAQCIVDNLTY